MGKCVVLMRRSGVHVVSLPSVVHTVACLQASIFTCRWYGDKKIMFGQVHKWAKNTGCKIIG